MHATGKDCMVGDCVKKCSKICETCINHNCVRLFTNLTPPQRNACECEECSNIPSAELPPTDNAKSYIFGKIKTTLSSFVVQYSAQTIESVVFLH